MKLSECESRVEEIIKSRQPEPRLVKDTWAQTDETVEVTKSIQPEPSTVKDTWVQTDETVEVIKSIQPEPSTVKDTWAQTDETMETLNYAREELEDVQEEFKMLVKSLRSKELEFNSEMKRRDEEQTQKENELQEALGKIKSLEDAREEDTLQKEKDMQKEIEAIRLFKESLESYVKRSLIWKRNGMNLREKWTF
ncbi:hypothetical protein WMY93_000034 [Mugilogobius chulae]|uniref:Uncharacterized protein n=1 Tax=Mugilogobius chulae TaxID=88201 RepID=A0AAW0PZT7_9GOBI